MNNIEAFFCASAKSMTPYSPIEPPDKIARRLGIPEDRLIKLDANENPFGTAPGVLKALGESQYCHIYPDPAQTELREAIARYTGCDPEMIVAGTGADELIDLTCRLILESGDKVLSFTPTFSYYSHVISLNKSDYLTVSRGNDFEIDLKSAQSVDLTNVKLVILCSPNNPSGNLLNEEVLDYFLAQNVVVMLDEAYYEFSQKTFIEKTKSYDNLIVLRTFSKCFGLAGLRVGYGVMSKGMSTAVMKIKPPFSVNAAAEIALKTCLSQPEFYREQVEQILEAREFTFQELSKIKELQVYPSHSNFILCRVLEKDAEKVWGMLEERGILIRYFKTEELKNFLRISIGSRRQMEIFLENLKVILAKV